MKEIKLTTMINIKYEGQPIEVWFTVSEVSKLLNLTVRDNHLKKRKHLGRNLFFKVLRYNKVLNKDNTPNQSFINLDLAKLYRTTSKRKAYTLPIFSERGIDFLKAQFKNQKYIVYYEQKAVKNKYVRTLDEIC